MKRILVCLFSFLLLASLMLAVALYVPNSLPAHSDFSAIYNTDLALINGISIYDLPAVREIALTVSEIPNEHFFLARFPYPPWFALATFYLGLLSAKAAATLWFELNLLMLFLSIWFLTDGWDGRLRLVAFPLALFFLPVLGTLSVGQYGFPVLLGASMLIQSLRKENVMLTTLGAILLTFKPHIGVLILLSVLIQLIVSRGNFGRRAMRSILVAGVFLFVAGFIADPSWTISYPKMLLNYQGEGNVSACSECVSWSVWLSRWFFDGSLIRAALIAVVLLVVLVALFSFFRSSLLRSHELFLSVALLATLLVSPYLYNYDYILLLIPFSVLAVPKSSIAERIVIVLCYFIPLVFLGLFGRDGNISLIASTMLVFILVFLRTKSLVDVPAFASYNTNN